MYVNVAEQVNNQLFLFTEKNMKLPVCLIITLDRNLTEKAKQYWCFFLLFDLGISSCLEIKS